MVDDQVDDAIDLGRHRLHGHLPGGRHAAPVDELEGEIGGARRGGHGLDDALVAVGRQEGGDPRIQRVAAGGQGDAGQQRPELGGQAGGRPPRIPHDQDLLGPHEGRHHLRDRHVGARIQDRQVDDGLRAQHLGNERGRNDPHRLGHHGDAVSGDDVAQRHAVVAGQGAVQLARILLVRLNGGPHPTGAGVGHGRRQGVGLGGVQLAQRVGQVIEGVHIEPAQGGVVAQDLSQQRGPPAVGELILDLTRVDRPVGQVLGQRHQAQLVELRRETAELGKDLSRGVVVGQVARTGLEVTQRHAHQLRGVLRTPEHGLDLGDGPPGPGGHRLHLVQSGRQGGPAAVGIVAAPDLAALLDLDQFRVQVAHIAPGAHQVLGLPDEAATGRGAHLDVALLAPPPGGRGDDQVGGGALEDLGDEDVEGVAHAVEHVELLAPVGESGGGGQTGPLGGLLDVPLNGRQQVIGEPGQLREHVGGLVDIGDRDAVPGRRPGPRGEDAQHVSAGQECHGTGAPGVVEAFEAPGRDPLLGAGAHAPGSEVGELLQGVVGGDPPGLAALVERPDVAGQARAHGHQALAHIDDGGDVEVGRDDAERLLDALARVTAPGGVLGQVQHDVAQAQVAQRIRDGVPVGAGGGHMQHGAARGGGVGGDGGQRCGDVGSGRGVQQQRGARADGLDGVELRGIEIAGAALSLGGAVLGSGGGQLDVERFAGDLVPGERGDERGGAGALDGGVEVLHERLTRVDEGAHDEALVHLEAGKVLPPQAPDARQRGPRGEALGGQGGVRDGLDIGGRAVAVQCPDEHRVDLDGRVQGERGLRGGAGQSHGAQQHGGVDIAHDHSAAGGAVVLRGPGGAAGGGHADVRARRARGGGA